jgi:hypothetical protein
MDIRTIEVAREFLRCAQAFVCNSPDELDDDDSPDFLQTLDMSDTWAWACADGEMVPDDKLPEVAQLCSEYGYCGLLYWVSEQRNQCRSEFADINRCVEFVRREEAIRRT